ncbi:hypothetical protein GCM10023320_49980 [Pseudonocardia adelaidensis]|uniref:Uncharacterized protein n=1 Tax=Pseudonocardia adelaidensis TaxID=648754 RepID=A0ABP9NP13_9PSEU
MEALLVTSPNTWEYPHSVDRYRSALGWSRTVWRGPVAVPVRRGRSVDPGRIAYIRVEFEVDQADVGRHPPTHLSAAPENSPLRQVKVDPLHKIVLKVWRC